MQAEESKKYSYLDQFKILKTLGAGYHAQVKLGMDDNGNLYAIKRYKKETANLSTLQHELNIMKVLQHENLVRLIDVRENATYKRKDQTAYSCFAIIIQYVGGGQLFDFIAQTGKFSEKITRTYFHQMMNGLHYMHSKGYAHRDIKPENILLGKDFILKLADFGFSCLLKGKDGSGILHTKLGTEGYMAPQIPTKNYDGAKADIFASGVILFIMYAGNPPFEKAALNDPYYKLIKQKNYATFWKAHSRRRSLNYFNDSFKDLFIRMTAYNPTQRPTIQQIAQHIWVKGDVCSHGEIKEQFTQRSQKLDLILQKRREEQELQKAQHYNGANTMGMDRGQLNLQASSFTDLLENEQQKVRKLGYLEPLSADDFIIDESPAYAFTLIKNLFKNKQVPVEDDTQIIGGELLSLKPVQTNDNQDTIYSKYELTEDVQGDKFTENVEIKVRIGQSSNDKLAVLISHVSGNRLYFKKIAKEIRNLFTYCKI